MYKCKFINGTEFSSFETNLNNLFKTLPPSAELVSIQHLSGTFGNLSGGYGKLNTKNDILVVWKE